MNRHILFITLSNIGDVILTTPVLTRLRQYDPSARMTVLVGPKAAPLLEGSRLIDRLIVYDKRVSWPEKAKLVLELRKCRYSVVVDLRNTAIPFLVPARRRSPLIRHFKKTRMRERHLEVLKMTGIPLDEKAPAFDFFSSEDDKEALKKLEGAGVDPASFFVFSAGAADKAKRWPLENYRALLSRLLEKRPESVVLIGDELEREYVDSLREADPRRVVNLAGGRTSLRQAAAVIARSRLLVSNDSAAMHLGYELGKKVVGIFGPTDADKYGHEGPFYRLIRPHQAGDAGAEPGPLKDVFQTVTPDRVLEACFELLSIPESNNTFSSSSVKEED